MATKEEILDKARIIFVDNRKGRVNINNSETIGFDEYDILSIDNFLKDKCFLKVGDNQSFYTNKDNTYHYLLSYWYKVLPTIAQYIGFPYKEEDFFLQEKYVEGEDYSYLIQKSSPMYKVCATIQRREEDYWVYFPNEYHEVCRHEGLVNQSVFNNITAWGSEYHKTFKYAHQSVIIENSEAKNVSTLIISSNSHSIPLVPILVSYYKKVIVLDSRLNNVNHDWLYKDEDINNIISILMISYDNNIDKFINKNF